MKILGFSAVVFPEGRSYTSWCPDLDVASQGKSMEKAIANLREAISLHLGELSAEEIRRLEKKSPRLVTTIEVPAPI